VVIDTLSRALAGGNENAPDDMGALVINTDKVRQLTGAALIYIHHSGKDAALGARGHSLTPSCNRHRNRGGGKRRATSRDRHQATRASMRR
jgi:RecA-family ATPase